MFPIFTQLLNTTKPTASGTLAAGRFVQRRSFYLGLKGPGRLGHGFQHLWMGDAQQRNFLSVVNLTFQLIACETHGNLDNLARFFRMVNKSEEIAYMYVHIHT